MNRVLRLVILAVTLLAGVDLARAQSAARLAGYLYLSPEPGAPYVSAQTRYVLVRFANVTPMEVTNVTSFITVTGAISGPHSGVTHVASDGRTVIFTMSVDFSPNELVTVTLNPQLAGRVRVPERGRHKPQRVEKQPAPRIQNKRQLALKRDAAKRGSGEDDRASGQCQDAPVLTSYEYQFMVTAPMPGSLSAAAFSSPMPVLTGRTSDSGGPSDGSSPVPSLTGGNAMAAAAIMPNGVSVPSDFPTVVTTINSNPSPGYLFLDTGNGSKPYTMILDNSGLPIWYRRGRMENFKTEQNHLITGYLESSSGGFPAFDQNFNYIQTFRTTNGYLTDSHDLNVLADGSYLMLGYRLNTVDMSRYVAGGRTNAVVTEGVVQEFTAAGELIFQWRAWDHYDIRDGTTDFPHLNALDVDKDGNILVSARHLSEITKINRNTGEIIWRLSGTKSSFTFLNDPLNGTSYQHSISALGNGRYMVFDNGNNHNPQVSRAVEYQLNLTNMTATMVWQFRDTPEEFSDFMGNAQRLPNGNTLINWVYDKIVEVDSNGAKHFEMNLVDFHTIYRVYRFPWEGVVKVPYLIVEPYPDNTTLLFNKFGDTNVAYYRIYGGTSPQPTNLLATSSTTLKRLTNLENGRLYYFRVTAVNRNGVESGYSNEENVTVNSIQPGQNMVANGNFSGGTNSWIWTVSGTGSAGWNITNAASRFVITNGGTTTSSLQLRQTSIPLIQGKKYVLEFDAWTSGGARTIEAKLQNSSGSLNYSGTKTPSLSPTMNHFRYVFTMQAASDFSAQLVFSLGGATKPVYLDNISLLNAPPGDFNLDGRVDLYDLSVMVTDWLKQQTNLIPDLDINGKVDFKDFGTLGENWSGP